MVLTPRRRRVGGILQPVEAGPRAKWWIEALIIVWLFWIYDLLGDLAPLQNLVARRHALSILHLEQAIHLDPEMAMNHWLAAHHFLSVLAGNYYDNAHFVVTLSIVGWLWVRYPTSYRPLRNGLVLCNLISFAVFWQYPMAPPRMLPGGKFVDIVAVSGAFGSARSGTLAKVADQLAAMPSLHVAWAVWSAGAVFVVWRHRRWIWLVWIYPVLTTLDVLSTANHFVADVVGGALTAWVAFWLGSLLDRRWQVTAARWRARQAGAVDPDWDGLGAGRLVADRAGRVEGVEGVDGAAGVDAALPVDAAPQVDAARE